jgi:hypothetical protein
VSEGRPVDVAATLPDGSTFEGLTGLRGLLVSHSDDFVQTFTEKLLAYAVGRGIEPTDLPSVRGIVREAGARDYRWSALVSAIVKSAPFSMSTARQGAVQRASR